MNRPELIVIVGPTAVGKTAFALQLAKKLNTCIVSADSRQFYTEIPIGSAQPDLEEQAGISHFFIGDRSITNQLDAGAYAREANALLEKLFQKFDRIILAGGSGLYVNALIHGFDELPEQDVVLRDELQNEYEQNGMQFLQNKLQALDPIYYNKVDKNNPARLIRAIEVCILTGKKYSELRTGARLERAFQVTKIGLDLPRAILYERINQRVDMMMAAGLEAEARAVYHLKNLPTLKTVGYTELFDYFEGKTDLSTAVSLIKQHSRNYAKRQMTWWRRDEEIKWFDPKEAVLRWE
jgi:tRNA dimethylallyltransferase